MLRNPNATWRSAFERALLLSNAAARPGLNFNSRADAEAALNEATRLMRLAERYRGFDPEVARADAAAARRKFEGRAALPDPEPRVACPDRRARSLKPATLPPFVLPPGCPAKLSR